ncbi:MAG TPA: hypothetical protein VED17_09840 [Nitrososphaerales archaeon]|nr:hypothetical protein [Nitrososphaerales archaeon]
MQRESESYNFFPLIVRFVVTEEKAALPEITKCVEKAVGTKVDQNALFLAISKLVELKILKLNEDTTGTFSLQDWKL